MRTQRLVIVADAGPAPTAKEGVSTTFRAVGYRQTVEPDARGGKANRKGFRFRNEALPALAASFKGQPFITAHDMGDVTKRGGTILDANVEQIDGDLAIVFEIEAVAAWAIEGLANGTIDRFSFAVIPAGEITCTVHNAPVWTKCDCVMGESQIVDKRQVVAEWEFAGGEGTELSAVNVPAVKGTKVLPAIAAADVPFSLELHAALCGRDRPMRTPATPPTAGVHAALCLQLGLGADATHDQVIAQLAATQRELAAARTFALATHVENEIARLRETHEIAPPAISSLRAAGLRDRATFDAAVELVASASPAIVPTGGLGRRPVLQSDAAPVADHERPSSFGPEPDAFDQHRTNPHLATMMRAVGLSVDEVREHGPTKITVLPNLSALADATRLRGD